ncbi:MAG TPA: RHS repeat-associated core domain-containing protein [Bacteroidales bacterium]|nr:RHS repeat-associated core domain-containing protein [Bacteroidales bacterium]HPI68926.1 RHS repeat-associated core domain-containing protein [Bacteroidales bacterium]HPR72479.1 RHS repeat-associated core domain-containing protein [Bacteroidales bacterium]HRW86141.1 RHS repeat-associated core domain-containing protein [Bacteroidales bacterium]
MVQIGLKTYNTANVVAITQNNTTIYYNLLRDHLGNITHIVNSENNNLVAEYSFDAWGRMRNPSTWENFSPDSVPELFVAGRGFTGHEHLPWFSLINMNGRLYDPLTGQFLSPDNYVQNPSSSQTFNRFVYCLNNPLKFTDPSGDTWLSRFGDWLTKNNISIQIGYSTNSINFFGGISYVGVSRFNYSLNAGVDLSNGNFHMGPNYGDFTNFYEFYDNNQHSNTAALIEDIGFQTTNSLDYNSETALYYWNLFFGYCEFLGNIYTNGVGTYISEAVKVKIAWDNGIYTINNKSGNAGFSDPILSSRKSNIYLNKSAFQSEWYLYLVLGHERVHLIDYGKGKFNPFSPLSRDVTELNAYSWMIRQTYINFPTTHYFYNKNVQKPLGINAYNEYIRLIKLYPNHIFIPENY